MAEGLVADSRVFRIGIHMRYQEQNIQTGFYLRDTGLSNKSADDAVDYAKLWVDGSFRGLYGPQTEFRRVDAFELTSREYSQTEYANTTGTFNVQNHAPSFIAVAVSLRSNQRSRHRNGRMFWPFTNRDAMLGSTILPAAVAVWAGAVDAFRDAFCGSPALKDFVACVVATARPAAGARPAIQHSWIDVETCRLNTVITHQHRRKVGVGS